MPNGVSYILMYIPFGVYSGLSDRVRMVYLFSLCVVSLLSSRFTSSELVCFSNLLRISYFTEHCVHL
jgi:hypothetical protein